MKNKELRSLSHEELNKKIIELRKDLIKENAQIATGTTPKSPGKVRNSKKIIAKIKTILNNKQEEFKKDG